MRPRGTLFSSIFVVAVFCARVLVAAAMCILAAAQQSQRRQPQVPGSAPSAAATAPGSCQISCQCGHSDGGGATAFVVQAPAPAADVPLEGKFKQAIPLLQSLIWPVLAAAVLIAGRKEFADLINRIRSVKVSELEFELVEPESAAPLSTAVPEDEEVPLEIRFG